jgi:hypothetical protein
VNWKELAWDLFMIAAGIACSGMLLYAMLMTARTVQ